MPYFYDNVVSKDTLDNEEEEICNFKLTNLDKEEKYKI